MSKNNFYIKNIIDIEKWQKLQDSLSLVTKMAIITVDYKGIPITSHSKCSDFCHCVRNDPKLSVLCQKCDARGGLEAVRINHPYIYLCHFNLIDIAVPILVDGQYIGAFMAGQVKLQDPSDEGELEHILQSSEHFCNKTMLKDYQNIPILSYTEVKNIALMLSDLCDYIISEAMHKNLISQLYEQKQPIKALKDAMIISESQASLDQFSFNDYNLRNTILYPALYYIYEHKEECVSLTKAASLCHISPSYFSRSFHKIMGENYSKYMNRLKIEWSKDLLLHTNLAVVEISESLGFNEAGYFIKLFKQYNGITPHLYRKNNV